MCASRPWRFMLLALLVSLLTSCGFHLRGNAQLEGYSAIYIQGDRHTELYQLLSAQLTRSQVQLLTQSSADAPILQLDQDSLKRRTLSLFANGQVAEYEIIYQVRYHLELPNSAPRSFDIELYRDYQDDPNRALAKARELDLVLTELRNQAVARIIRQLDRDQPKVPTS